jgi:oligopeptide transport system substrate-binding protein
MLFGPATSTSSAQGAFIQEQLQKNLGIKVDLVYSVDGPTYFKARTKGEFDICAGGWGADYNDVASFFPLFTTKNGNNNGKYSSAKYDELVTAAGKEMDPAKRVVNYKEAEKLLLVDDAAVSPYFYQDVNSFQHNYLKGMYLQLFGGYYDLRGVYISGKQ